MKYRIRKITYRIDDCGRSREVQGFALDWPTVRLCFRHTPSGWRCDHYDSGYKAGPFYMTITDAIRGSIRLFENSIQTGNYAECIKSINYYNELNSCNERNESEDD